VVPILPLELGPGFSQVRQGSGPGGLAARGSLSTDPRFIALIERSRARYKPGTGIRLEEIKRKYGIKSKSKPARRSRKAR